MPECAANPQQFENVPQQNLPEVENPSSETNFTEARVSAENLIANVILKSIFILNINDIILYALSCVCLKVCKLNPKTYV